MFHVEQIFVLSGVASACLSATLPSFGDELAQQTIAPCPALPSTSAPAPSFHLPLASESEDAIQETALGFQNLLLGDDVEAERHFTAAIAHDDLTPLPYVGLCLLTRNTTGNRAELLSRLKEKLEHMTTTPVEAFYLSSFLGMLEHRTADAAQAWKDRALRYRRDNFAAAWATLLLHYSDQAYDANGSALLMQQDASNLIKPLYEKNPEDGLFCYLRALVEENAKEISDEAKQAALKAKDVLHDAPSVFQLSGHMAYRLGKYTEASNDFNRSAVLAHDQKKPFLYLRARHYESVALWSAGRLNDAQKIQKELQSHPADHAACDEQNIFLCWEVRTLPLRLLILREKAPSEQEIRSAMPQQNFVVKGRGVATDKPSDSLALGVRCIFTALTARTLHAQQKTAMAQQNLNLAEALLRKYDATKDSTIEQSLLLLTPWERIRTACFLAINKAKEVIYPSTQDTWRENIRTSLTPGDSTLPPIAPSQKH